MKKRQRLNKKKSPLLDEVEQRRVLFVLIVVILCFLVVFVKLYQVMIIDKEKYSKKCYNSLLKFFRNLINKAKKDTIYKIYENFERTKL